MLTSLKKQLNHGITENGAVTHNTTNSYVLDYFAQGCSLRSRNITDKTRMFQAAFNENPLIATKILFYSRDILEGQGERQTFRDILTYLAFVNPEVVKMNMHLIPEFGRWDDIYSLFHTPLEKEAIKMIEKQLFEDLNTEYPSLLAKWLKSENTSSEESRELAYRTRIGLKMGKFRYQRVLGKLRKKLHIIESYMTDKEYDKIEYSKIPSLAMLKYAKAFKRNDEERYSKYLESLVKGETKVNVKALAPYQLVDKVLNKNIFIDNGIPNELLNEMWNNIPDYIGNNTSNCLSVVDVSGSMFDSQGSINMSISLGLYLAERNKGAFGNHFITFSERPVLNEIIGTTFCDKVNFIRNADWGYSTNVKAVFDLVLNAAIKDGLKQEDMPEKIFIISDMEFNRADNRANETLFETIKAEYNFAGYKLPKLVFWNVASRQNNIPMIPDEEGRVQLVSGSNPVIFEKLLKEEILTQWDLMMEVIGNKRYDCIKI